MRPGEALRVVLRSGSGRMGIGLLAVLVFVSLLVPFFYPLDFGLRFWNNPIAWADNPKAAPPAWTNLVGDQAPRHRVFDAETPTQTVETGPAATRLYSFTFDHESESPPTFLSVSVGEVTFYDRPPVISMTLARPDGRAATILQEVVRGQRPDESPPITRFADEPRRIYLTGDTNALTAASDFLQREFNLRLSEAEMQGNLEAALFGTPISNDAAEFEPLTGEYTATIRVITYNPRDSVESVRFVAAGGVFGLMGTDTQGRNLATGLMFGFPVALIIGISTSVAATILGTFFGILSGFSGGRTDTVIQRLSDVMTNIPLLPILIFLIFVLGQKLWLVMTILVIFGWPGLTIILRSMVLQVRSGQLVEATQALGASRWRIMFRHVFFQMAPFIVAQMIFFTPAAILAEAGLSFLGLGDPSLPTWGQILEQGFRTGAIFIGYWWWILPPGILIVITAMTFVLLALAMEPVLNPRLRETAA